MLLYFASGRSVYASHFASGRKAYNRRSAVRSENLCFFIWHPSGNFTLLILPLGGKLIIQDQVYGRIAYASLFCIRTASLCFSFCLRAVRLLYKISCPAGKSMILYFVSRREAYNTRSDVRPEKLRFFI